MKEFDSLLDETLEAWKDARDGAVEEFRNIPAKHWDFRPAVETKSVKELAVHILEVAMMMTGELTRPDTNFRRASWPKLLERYAGAAYRAKTRRELLRILVTQRREADKLFRKSGEIHLLQWIERFDGRRGTRFAWLQHGIAQEMYHRGQLATYARLLGIEPALTKRIRGA